MQRCHLSAAHKGPARGTAPDQRNGRDVTSWSESRRRSVSSLLVRRDAISMQDEWFGIDAHGIASTRRDAAHWKGCGADEIVCW